ncbi:ureidoglycolate hydrolase [Sporothrix brasiliensis 5110]|uniref:Ureidoglycolate hydrolase n=1 Tax=Sporothrix brasiliensis 5110 TaxID=1398154 RepID=A0A0C2IBR7_9PEZI|nr:ureidoglycolate hydrolase [Sporothrix brasiliensis 5110]KIH86716.1 ureidoglycolate hydrolase [Sporothrix brasiliensis 5110]
MPDRLDVAALRLAVPAEPLTAAAFAPFGDVIENPRPDVHPSQFAKAFGSSGAGYLHHPVSANQGSAIKYQRVSGLADRYASGKAPSGMPSEPLASMFVCGARTLLEGGRFPVTILERHPYTTQTFVPLSQHSAADTRYLVIVAPTLPDATRNNPPDVRGLRAFVARGDQAVTYGAATWHAPMAALGAAGTSLPFFVFQFANGVGPEDCQEVVLDSGAADAEGTSSVVVRVPSTVAALSPSSSSSSSSPGLWSKL